MSAFDEFKSVPVFRCQWKDAKYLEHLWEVNVIHKARVSLWACPVATCIPVNKHVYLECKQAFAFLPIYEFLTSCDVKVQQKIHPVSSSWWGLHQKVTSGRRKLKLWSRKKKYLIALEFLVVTVNGIPWNYQFIVKKVTLKEGEKISLRRRLMTKVY